jgi:hypothetical protein
LTSSPLPVAGLYERQGPARLGFGADMQDHRAEGGAGHARIGHADHVAHALPHQRAGIGMLPTSAMPG